MLTALAGSVDAFVGPGDQLTIVLRKSREYRGRCDGGDRGRLDRGVRRHAGRACRGAWRPLTSRTARTRPSSSFAGAAGSTRPAARRGAADRAAEAAGRDAADPAREPRAHPRPGAVRAAAPRCPPGDAERLRIRGELVELHLPLVEYLARRFRNRGEWLDDLTQVATIGLIKSIDRFDLERGVEFSTYATPTIVGEIKRHFRDKGWAVRVPRRLQELQAGADQGHRRAGPAATAARRRSPSSPRTCR